MKKKVLMAMGIVLMCGLVGCGSKESVEKEVSTNKQAEKEDSVDSTMKNPYKKVEMSGEKMVRATSIVGIPKQWILEMTNDFCYTNKGKIFMFANDAPSSYIIEACSTLEEMPNACMSDIEDMLKGHKTVCGYGYGLKTSITKQELVTISNKEMLKVKGNVKDENEALEHNFIAYFTFHEPCLDETEPYPVYFAYFYPEGTDETEIEAYAYESAATLELTN